jgi:nucleoid-associated protein YgaU
MAQNEQRFEQLKQKYSGAINLMQQLQVKLAHIHMEGDKLFIQGEAPSEDAKNKVWNQIKLIDSTYSDLACDLSVSQAQAPQTMSAGASISGGQQGRRYTVQSGDTLSKVAQQFYGSGKEYMKIFEANRNVLSDPNKIQPGQELVIPD